VSTIITEDIYNEQEKNDRISCFFRKFQLGKAVKEAGFYKEKGVRPVELLRYLFSLVFMNRNLYREVTNNPQQGKGKNTMYRFLSSTAHDWCRLLYCVAMRAIMLLLPLTSEERENVLIVDDTLYSRNRSKKVDMLTRVYDHNTNSYLKGFKLLTLAWSDGNTTIPLSYRHLVSTNKKMVINSLPEDMDKRKKAYKLRKSAQMKAVDAMFELLSKLDMKKLKVKYLLFDSWFAFPSVIEKVLSQKLNVICMLKRMYRVYYSYNGKLYNLDKLYSMVPHGNKKVTVNGKEHCVISSINVNLSLKEYASPAKIVFLKTNDGNNWVALLSTDTSLSDEEIIRLYSKRWNIEVLFKTAKHYLRLDTESQSRRFEAIYAQTTIVYLRYIMLAYESRASQDARTCGDIFFLVCDEMKDISFLDALDTLLCCFAAQIREQFVIPEQQINAFINIFVANIPLCFDLRVWES